MKFDRLANGLAQATQVAAMVVAWLLGCFFLVWGFDGPGAFGQASFMWFLLLLPAILVHEAGHFLAARAVGMKVLLVQLPLFRIHIRRRGFWVCWSPIMRGLGASAYVVAFADPDRKTVASRCWYLLGGVLANLTIAVILGLAGWWVGQGPTAGLLFGFAVINVSFVLVNLVPTRGKQLPSDGYQLLKLARTRTAAAMSPMARLVARSLFGCPADRLPEADLEALEALPYPMSLVALSYRHEAWRARGQWARAAAMQSQLDALVQGVPEARIAQAPDLLALVRTELAFSAAIESGCADKLDGGRLPRRTARLSPHVWPRCLALRAALRGDRLACDQWLFESGRYAEGSIDDSLRAAERSLRERVSTTCSHVQRAASLAG